MWCAERERLEKLQRACLEQYVAALQAVAAFAEIDGADCSAARMASDEAHLTWENVKTAVELHCMDHRCGSAIHDLVSGDAQGKSVPVLLRR
jgi:hypothetical protein